MNTLYKQCQLISNHYILGIYLQAKEVIKLDSVSLTNMACIVILNSLLYGFFCKASCAEKY